MDNVYNHDDIYPFFPQRGEESCPRILKMGIRCGQRAWKESVAFSTASYPHNTALVKKE